MASSNNLFRSATVSGLGIYLDSRSVHRHSYTRAGGDSQAVVVLRWQCARRPLNLPHSRSHSREAAGAQRESSCASTRRRRRSSTDHRLHQRGAASSAVLGRRRRGVLCDGPWTPGRHRHRRKPRGLPGSTRGGRRGVGPRSRVARILRSPTGNRSRSGQASQLIPPWGSVSRRKPLTSLLRLGFTGPYSGGRHKFMARGDLVLTIPNPHSGGIGVGHLVAILRQAGVTRAAWEDAWTPHTAHVSLHLLAECDDLPDSLHQPAEGTSLGVVAGQGRLVPDAHFLTETSY